MGLASPQTISTSSMAEIVPRATTDCRHLTIDRPGGNTYTMAVYSWGNPDNSPIFCVHGLTGNAHEFDWIAPCLVEAGFFVMAPDMPGRGQSDFLTDPEGYRYRYYLQDCMIALSHYGYAAPHSVDWLGVSMGGLFALSLAGIPESVINRLILVDIGYSVPKSALNMISAYLALPHIYPSLETLVTMMQAANVPGPFYRGALDTQTMTYIANSKSRHQSDGQLTLHYDPRLAEWFAREPLGEADLKNLWPKTHQPVLALRGGMSTIFPSALAEQMLAEKQGHPMQLRVFEDCGHVPPLIQRAQIACVLNWLRDTQK